MTTRVPFKWNTANFAWNDGTPFPNQSTSPFTWDDVALIEEVVDVVRAGGSIQDVFKDKEKKKRFIKLICQVQGVEYKETKEVKDFKIRIRDVEMVVKEVLGIDLKVRL
jgi:hypothetical protein